MNNKALFSSARDDWGTPQYIFDELNEEFEFTLDPCASESNHKCEKYFTKEQDGLAQSWENHVVFCNPPYGRKIGLWVKKAYEESRFNNAVVVLLIPARTDTKWFHEYIYGKTEVRFYEGRIKFVGAEHNAPFPSMVVVFMRWSHGE